MAKKNPYVFTIGFDEADPGHVRAAEILNGTKKKAQLIAAAILSYVDSVDSERIHDFHVESLQPLLEKLIQKELEKAMGGRLANSAGKESSLQLRFWSSRLKRRKWMKVNALRYLFSCVILRT